MLKIPACAGLMMIIMKMSRRCLGCQPSVRYRERAGGAHSVASAHGRAGITHSVAAQTSTLQDGEHQVSTVSVRQFDEMTSYLRKLFQIEYFRM